MSSQQNHAAAQPGQSQGDPLAQQVEKMLRTPWQEVIAISKDGKKYTAPESLKGTPVEKLTEDGPNWKPTWDSLNGYMALEYEEERLKKESSARLKVNPDSKSALAAHKLHQDNVSKHRRIRDIFGPKTSYHPNQLVSGRHLPDEGLCQKELMYRIACKVNDLRVLHERGKLTMDPWDFFRWRISKKISAVVNSPLASAQDNLRTIIYRICEDGGSNSMTKQYEDPLLRAAILQSAVIQNRLNSFNAKGNDKAKAIGAGVGG
ncbi:acyl- thioesterase ii [Fusarium albosuccineum]|uniref:Acyl- thioesterase ii n=1 Tax=Fusarium albosuccineum TaxID=1237068 RepID=A0A8H4PA69_9HYPO|nr:acyl- thioesterase ii [Fusarium albosuccineum]